MLGTAILSDCTTYSPPFCDATDVPVPGVPYSTITATYTVATNFDGAIGKIDDAVYSYVGYSFCLQTTIEYVKARFPFGISGGYQVESWTVDSTSTATVVWNLSATTIVNGFTGVYKRPGTNQVLATNIAWKGNQYTYTRSSATGTSTDYAIVTNSYDSYFECCSNSTFTTYFDSIVPGGTSNRTPVHDFTVYLQWLGASTSNVSGFNLTLTAAGNALAPWFVEVSGGQITFTDKNGNTTSYSGSLTSVRNAINVWPSSGGRYFTAAIPSNINSAATTSDLKKYKSPPLRSTTCTTGLPIVLIGEKVTPSSVNVGFGGFAFNPADGFTDDEAGANAFLSSTWTPKSSGFHSGQYYYMSNEWDGYFYLSSSAAGWSLTGGNSTHTNDYVLAETTSTYGTQTFINSDCYDSKGGGDPCAFLGDPYCNGISGGFLPGTEGLDCNANPWPQDCFPYGLCWCQHYEETIVTVPELTLTAVQVLEGSLKFS